MHFAFTQKCRMVDLDIRRQPVECRTSDSRNWFLLNFKIFSVPLALGCKLSGFSTVALEELKNGAHLDRRVYKDVVSIDSSFGVLSAILRPKVLETRRKRRVQLVR